MRGLPFLCLLFLIDGQLTLSAPTVDFALVGTSYTDPACPGAWFSGNDPRFCCGGKIYYDPLYMFTCCSNGQVCTRNQPSLESIAADYPKRTITQDNSVYCGDQNLSWLQATNPKLACCRGKIIYDIRVWDCDGGRTPAPPLPTTTAPPFQPLTCGSNNYFIDVRIRSSYFCCGSIIYDRRSEICHNRRTFPSGGQGNYVDLVDNKKTPERTFFTCKNGDIMVFATASDSWNFKC